MDIGGRVQLACLEAQAPRPRRLDSARRPALRRRENLSLASAPPGSTIDRSPDGEYAERRQDDERMARATNGSDPRHG